MKCESGLKKQLLVNISIKKLIFFVTVKLAGFRYTINGEIGAPGTKSLL
jgi:polysaccharide export outer membrane protein